MIEMFKTNMFSLEKENIVKKRSFLKKSRFQTKASKNYFN